MPGRNIDSAPSSMPPVTEMDEFKQNMKKYRKQRYNPNTGVAKELEDQAEDLHKKLKLNKVKEH